MYGRGEVTDGEESWKKLIFFFLRYELLAGKKGLEAGRVERRWTERTSLSCGLCVKIEEREEAVTLVCGRWGWGERILLLFYLISPVWYLQETSLKALHYLPSL